MTGRSRIWLTLSVGTLVLAAMVGAVWQLNVRDDIPIDTLATPAKREASTALIQRGAYLARAGNCMTCHTVNGATPYAGGRGINTPFGSVYSSNLTPDPDTGLGRWTSDEFWRALHNGRAKDGRLLYPAFPYTNYTEVSRPDSDALYAFLQSLPPTTQTNTEHQLRWPFSTQAALAVWRALYFQPGRYTPDVQKTVEWNRGAYLVRGLGHCSACHSSRNALGANDSTLDLAGGLIPMQNWYAPALTSATEAGVADWPTEHIVELLKTGVSPRGSVLGPMAEVVLHSTQYLSDADLQAMAQFLKTLPQTAAIEVAPAPMASASAARVGAKLYEQHCVQCHGEQGQGIPGAYPALAGNRAVTLASPANLVQVVLNGGFAPATAGNPRPFGMPPFVLVMNDVEVASLLSFIRSAWGNQASALSTADVNRLRSQANN
jgi:mono/diheme cytochrome c family protein